MPSSRACRCFCKYINAQDIGFVLCSQVPEASSLCRALHRQICTSENWQAFRAPGQCRPSAKLAHQCRIWKQAAACVSSTLVPQ